MTDSGYGGTNNKCIGINLGVKVRGEMGPEVVS